MNAREVVPLAASGKTTKRGYGRSMGHFMYFGAMIRLDVAQVKRASLPIARLEGLLAPAGALVCGASVARGLPHWTVVVVG